MSEQEFWATLQFRLTDELDLGYCDWIEVKRYRIGAPESQIDGRVGFVRPQPDHYELSLLLPSDCDSLEKLQWDRLIPEPAKKGWASIDGRNVIVDLRGE